MTSVTCEVGSPPPPKSGGHTHGEWRLWISYCSWRVEQSDRVLIGSDDERDDLEKAIQVLEKLMLQGIEDRSSDR